MREKQPGLEKFKYATSATSSELGLWYLLAITIIFATLFRLFWIFFTATQGCYPVWEVWLSGSSKFNTVFWLSCTCFASLGLLTTLDLLAHVRAQLTVNWSILVGYASILIWVLSMGFVMFIYWGAMHQETFARETYEAVMNEGYKSGRYFMDDWMVPIGHPYGACNVVQQERHDQRLEWEEESNEENFVKKSYFEERDWSTWDPKTSGSGKSGLRNE